MSFTQSITSCSCLLGKKDQVKLVWPLVVAELFSQHHCFMWQHWAWGLMVPCDLVRLCRCFDSAPWINHALQVWTYCQILCFLTATFFTGWIHFIDFADFRSLPNTHLKDVSLKLHTFRSQNQIDIERIKRIGIIQPIEIHINYPCHHIPFHWWFTQGDMESCKPYCRRLHLW